MRGLAYNPGILPAEMIIRQRVKPMPSREECMNSLINAVEVKTMSSREIAELTGKRHDNVLADIRKMLAEIQSPEKLGDYKDGKGRTYQMLLLDKEETLILISGYHSQTEHPATDAFLAEVRAQGVDAAIEAAKNLVAKEYECKDFKAAQSDCCMHPGSDMVGKVEMTEWLVDFAAQLRKGE
nr:MAG TPA: hypothetical protein [Caudoviricetes sp.]